MGLVWLVCCCNIGLVCFWFWFLLRLFSSLVDWFLGFVWRVFVCTWVLCCFGLWW